jgi:hypothetical protein
LPVLAKPPSGRMLVAAIMKTMVQRADLSMDQEKAWLNQYAIRSAGLAA